MIEDQAPSGPSNGKDTRPYRYSGEGEYREAILYLLSARDGLNCALCGKLIDLTTKEGPDRPSIDHKTPVCEGGPHRVENFQLTHLGCNHAKAVQRARKTFKSVRRGPYRTRPRGHRVRPWRTWQEHVKFRIAQREA